MSMFPAMIDLVPEGRVGNAEVVHFDISDAAAMMESMRGQMTFSGRYAELRVYGQLVMSDTSYEKRSNYGVVLQARGHVLIAGLGLGMILHPILAKAYVESVTVVEISADVIELIRPTLPTDSRLTLVNADISTWRPPKGTKYDCIYFDIWPDICTDNLAEMRRLHQAFKFFKAPDGWMESRDRDRLRYVLAREKRERAMRGWR